MTSDEARIRVIGALAQTKLSRVYEVRASSGRRSAPDVIVMDEQTGALARVRVLVGSAPKRSKRASFPANRDGIHADVVALVHPRTGEVLFRPPEPPESVNPSVPMVEAPAPALAVAHAREQAAAA